MDRPPECSEYEFVFEGGVGAPGSLRYRGPSHDQWRPVSLIVDDTALWLRSVPAVEPHIADLIDLTAAIYAADRLSPQKLEHSSRRIALTVPLRDPQSLSSSALTKLQDLLSWTTAGEWSIEIATRTADFRPVEAQSLLIPMAPDDSEVVLWSGGLDALAGVYSRLRTENKVPLVLLGSGGNDRVLGKQRALLQRLESLFPGRVYAHRIPLRLRGISEFPQDRLMRGRGVVFMLLGLVSSYLLGQHHLCVHENGIGALNLPFRESSVGLDHVRSVHPFTLAKVSDFVTSVLGADFRVENPSFLSTKAQMLEHLAQDSRADLVALTESCDSYHRKQYGQCGYCSSCLLRRQSILASGLRDQTKYVVPDGEPPRRDPSIPFRAMTGQVATLGSALTGAPSRDEGWERLTRSYPSLDDVADRCASRHGLTMRGMREKLMQLYSGYIGEWNMARYELAVGIMDWQPYGVPRERISRLRV